MDDKELLASVGISDACGLCIAKKRIKNRISKAAPMLPRVVSCLRFFLFSFPSSSPSFDKFQIHSTDLEAISRI